MFAVRLLLGFVLFFSLITSHAHLGCNHLGPGVDLSNCDYSKVNFIELQKSLGHPINLSGTNLTGVKFIGNKNVKNAVIFERAKFNQTILTGADFSGSNFNKATFYNTDFTDTNMTDAKINEATEERSTFTRTNLTRVHAKKIKISNASTFSDVVCHDADFREAKILGSKIMTTNLNHPHFGFIRTNFQKVDFTGTQFLVQNFSQSKLNSAIMPFLINKVNFTKVDFTGATFNNEQVGVSCTTKFADAVWINGQKCQTDSRSRDLANFQPNRNIQASLEI